MSNFDYVSKDEYMPVKKDLINLFNTVQNDIRDKFTFSYEFIGSASRNMITRDYDGNTGYDFDINVRPNDPDQKYDAGEIKRILMNAIDRHAGYYRYGYCEDSTRVITFKFVDKERSRIIHSCDVCIVYDCGDGRQQYIHFNKNQNSYYWAYQPKRFYKLPEKIEWIKQHGLWQEVRDRYLYNKDNNDNPDKKSRSIFAETIAQIYNENK